MTANRSFAILVLLAAGCAAKPPAVPPPPAATATAPAPLPSATSRPSPAPLTETPAASAPAHSTNLLPVIPLRQPCAPAGPAISFSPKKTWALVACREPGVSAGTTLRAVRMDGGAEWDTNFKYHYIDRYKPQDPDMDSLLQKSFIPAGWTSDEQYAYLAVQTGAQDVPFPGYDGLFRLDLDSFRFSPILKPAAGELVSSYAFQFSPGGTQLAYVNQAYLPLVIVIQNTVSGAENRLTLDARFSQAGSFLWSPDEKQLLVSVFDKGIHGGNSVILFDLAGTQPHSRFLVQNSASIYLPRSWAGATQVHALNYPSGWVSIDTETGTITPAPAPTPMP